MRFSHARSVCTALLLSCLPLTAPSAHASAIVSTFTGGDVGEGIDLEGVFIYTIDVGSGLAPDAPTLRGRTFSLLDEISLPAGILWQSPRATGLGSHKRFGLTQDDRTLLDVMRFRSTSQSAPIRFEYQVIPGLPYQLQLLLDDDAIPHFMRVEIEGNPIADVTTVPDPLLELYGTGKLVTYTYTAADPWTSVTISGLPDAPAELARPILNAFTVELLPEPSSFLAMTAAAALIAARRPRARSDAASQGPT